MNNNTKYDKYIQEIEDADTDNFVDLVRIARLDPAFDFQNSNLSEVNFANLDLSGFNFNGSVFDSCNFDGATIGKASFNNARVDIEALRRSADWGEYLAVNSLKDRQQNEFALGRRIKEERSGSEYTTLRQYELVQKVLHYDPAADEALLNRAYVYAMKAHGQQKSVSGDPYFSRSLAVAAILTEYELDDTTIATALLHDTIEDTNVTKAEIDELFGKEIGALVDGLTKIDRLYRVSNRAEQAANFRKLLIAVSIDIRVLLVKLADRLHNMRTLEHKKPESRRRDAKETLEIYAPLAGRMGMQEMKEELEELSFRWLHPEAYETLTGQLATLHQHNRGMIQKIEAELTAKFTEYSVKAQVDGYAKKAYSIWHDMVNEQIPLEQFSDVYTFLILVEQPADCYVVLSAVRNNWIEVNGTFKDYISTPKINNYQSIHTTVIGPDHKRIELHIRTKSMDEIAGFGIASYALYKDGAVMEKGNHRFDDARSYQWLRKLVMDLVEGDYPEDFREDTKLELFQDHVFCFTPQGRIVALPRGATPIDFAYAVHTDVGNHCVGAKVNGRHVPLISEIRNRDEVEIITSDAQIPPRAWEGVVVTRKARSAIRRATRQIVREHSSKVPAGDRTS